MKHILLVVFLNISCIGNNYGSDDNIDNVENINKIIYFEKQYDVQIEIIDNEIIEKNNILTSIIYYNYRGDVIKYEWLNGEDVYVQYTTFSKYSYDKIQNTISRIIFNHLNIPEKIVIYYLDENKKTEKTETLNIQNELLHTEIYRYNEYGNIIFYKLIVNNLNIINTSNYFYNQNNQLVTIESKNHDCFVKNEILSVDERGRIIKSISYYYDDEDDTEPFMYMMFYSEYCNIE